MAYTVFARKYRPQTFADLAGQEHVAKTLTGAIAVGRVAHAFLFTGVRGVGKTSAARVLAKALNCETGPTATPCNVCSVCKDVTAGVDMDVVEMDGASNNSVDDVRRLQETLPFRPARGRFKVVIVDEVHMLSTAAFNAFLKTLEEPPPHVKFIFATTESHKVPITIRSRCQRYDFRLIPRAIIAERVRAILESEKVQADDATVALVAREAAGSMRDALTLLDQIVAFGGDRLEGEEVARHLGIAARGAVQSVVQAILDGDAGTVLRFLDESLAQGTDPLHFTNQLLHLLRDLVVLSVTGDDSALVDLVAEEKKAARVLADSRDVLELQRVFSVVSKVVDEVAQASSPKLVLEMGLVRAATRPALQPVGELLARLKRLESQIGPGRAAAAGRSRAPGGGRPREERAGDKPAPPRGAPRAPRASQPSAATTDSSAGAPAEAPGSRRAESAGPIGATAPSAASGGPTGAAMASSAPSAPRSAPSASAPSSPASASRSAPASASRSAPAPARSTDPRERPFAPDDAAPARPARAERSPGPSQSPAAGPKPAEVQIRRAALLEWERIVAALRGPKPALAAVLEHAEPRVVTGERVVIAFKKGSFYGHQAGSPDARDIIGQMVEKTFGKRPKIEVVFDAKGGGRRTVAVVEETRRDGELAARKREALAHPVVRDAMQIFPASRGKVAVKLADHAGESDS